MIGGGGAVRVPAGPAAGGPGVDAPPGGVMGKAITALEKRLRKAFPATPQGERPAGGGAGRPPAPGDAAPQRGPVLAVLAHSPPAGICPAILLVLAGLGHAVPRPGEPERLPVSHLPGAARGPEGRGTHRGPDTEQLTEEGVTRAAVETVAENFSDGGAGPPAVHAHRRGAPGPHLQGRQTPWTAWWGTKTERYLHFGRAAAKLDDAANYLPARLAALLWIIACPLAGGSAKGAWRVWRRDRRNHASPNSAQTESACAGSLGVQLAGPASYFGKRVEKPTIGDPPAGHPAPGHPPGQPDHGGGQRGGVGAGPGGPVGRPCSCCDKTREGGKRYDRQTAGPRRGLGGLPGGVRRPAPGLFRQCEPPRVPEGVAKAIAQAAGEADRYPDPLCRSLVGKLAAREGVPSEFILCGNGAADLIFRAVLARKPKLALVTAPTFAEYEAALEAWGCPVRRCLLREGQDFRLGEDFLRAITPEVDMVFLCEPNNPTGLTSPRTSCCESPGGCRDCGAPCW